MSLPEIALAGLAAIALFIYALQGFANELETAGGERLKGLMAGVTASPLRGYLFGIFATAVIQSSSAVTAFLVAFVDAGIICFRGALPALLGANVGTASTAFLLSFKLGAFGSIFIVVGFLATFVPPLKLAGRAIFYFGLILFALNLVSEGLSPLREHPAVVTMLTYAAVPVLGILAGAAVTAVVQSSSITIGLAVILVQQDLLPLGAILPLVIGANIGSTSTALLASLGMGVTARRVALANTVFNVAGAIVALPVVILWGESLIAALASPQYAVAVAHLAFNLLVSTIGFSMMRPLEHWLAP